MEISRTGNHAQLIDGQLGGSIHRTIDLPINCQIRNSIKRE